MKSPKQTIVVRKDLNMRKGKLAAQVAHASMKVFFDKMTIFPNKFEPNGLPYAKINSLSESMVAWMEGPFTKIVLGCDSEDEIHDLASKAKTLKIPYAVIEDSGKTEFYKTPTITCIALGPCDSDIIEQLTQQYKLL